MTRHFTQVGLFNIIQVLTGRGGQPFTHLFIGQDLVLQNAHFGQRFTARGTAAGGIMVNISQLAMEERWEKRERRWKVRVSCW